MAKAEQQRKHRGAGVVAASLVVGLVAALAQPAAGAVAPTLAVSSWRVEFGDVPLGATSAPKVVTITNLGPGTATGLAVGTIDHPDYARTTTCGSTLGAGRSCTVSIVLHSVEDPDHVGQPAYAHRVGHLRISSAGGSSPLIDVVGRAGYPEWAGLDVNPRYADLGRVPVGSVTKTTVVTVTNRQPTALDQITPTSADPRFEIASNGCTTPIASGASCTIGLRYRPTAAGTPDTSISLRSKVGTSNGPSSTVEVRGGGPLTVGEAFARRMYSVFFGPVPTWKQVRTLADEVEGGARSRRSVATDFLYTEPWVRLQVMNLLTLDARIDSISGPPMATPYVNAILRRERTLASVEIELASRPGVVEYRGGGTAAGWVAWAYQHYLGRAPDPAGLAFWVSRAERLGVPAVARSLYNDPWSLRRRINLRYQEALGRQADPAGIAYWSPRLAKRGDQDLGISLAVSPEFLRRAHQFPWDDPGPNPD